MLILTETVINEVDKFKKGNEDKNFNAREFNRQLKELRRKGNIYEGIKYNNSIIKFEFNHP
jgi:predicted ribonuclease YlaK